LTSVPLTSSAILIDILVPTMNAVIDLGDFVATTSRMVVGWQSSIGPSGLLHYEYALSTATENTLTWINVGVSENISVTSSLLEDRKTIYAHVRATNRAGVLSPVKISDGITIDLQKPIVNRVIDAGRIITTSNSLSGTWIATTIGPAPIVKYEYDILKTTDLGATAIFFSDYFFFMY